MIRDRRDADLERLCAVLETMRRRCRVAAGDDLRAWLEEPDAERSWVYDMAPVRVAPTRNVVGHVQIYSPSPTSPLVECTERPAPELLVIGKLFVKPETHEYGIGRYLLKESIKYVRGRGRLPVLDLHENCFEQAFFERFGFQALGSGDADVEPMVHTQ